jgi:hypothetical protein
MERNGMGTPEATDILFLILMAVTVGIGRMERRLNRRWRQGR